MVFKVISTIALLLVGVATAYLLLLAFASARRRRVEEIGGRAKTRFAIAIAAHNESAVIGRTVERIWTMNYPSECMEVHVVADHCSDDTVAKALEAGATVHERNEGQRTGKGAALSWLFVTGMAESDADAVVVVDADSIVHPNFLSAMNQRLLNGDVAIQGQHIISNSSQGWFPALTSAMFLVDNRFHNLGRTNLGLSAKNMGDAICIRFDTLLKYGWGQGLTEDYELRQRMLLDGIKIQYEPGAVSYGEAPYSLGDATAQRTRWLAGSQQASITYRWQLLRKALVTRNPVVLDGAIQTLFPSYSTITLIAVFALLLHLVAKQLIDIQIPWALIAGWGLVVGILGLYPLFGLALERAQAKSYLAILMGPVFILWRAWLVTRIKFQGDPQVWVRTTHGDRA